MKKPITYTLMMATLLHLTAHAGPPIKPTPSTQTPQDPFADRTQTDQTGIITAETGGIWYNPDHNGEGFFIQIANQIPPLITVTWYTYSDEGQQMWLIGTAEYNSGDNQVTIEMVRPQGTRFGALFNGGDIIQTSWGTMTFRFNSCADGVAVFESKQPNIYGNGTIPITKLAENASVSCLSPPLSVDPPFYSREDTVPKQGFGVGTVSSIGEHQVNGVHITSERLLVKDNRCHFEVTLKNNTGSNRASAGLSYQFISQGQEAGSLGTGAVFTKNGQSITKTIEIIAPQNTVTGQNSCNLYDTIKILDFQAASL